MEPGTTPAGRNRLAIVSLKVGTAAAISFLFSFILAGLIESLADVPSLYVFLLYVFYALIAFALIGPITAVTAGIMSLVQIKKHGESGLGQAITGIILGLVGFTPIILLVSSWW
jgi:hypothetical protein